MDKHDNLERKLQFNPKLASFIRTSPKGHHRWWNLNTTTLNTKMYITIRFISLQSSVDPFPFKLSLLRWYWIPTFLKLSLIYHYLYYKNKSCKRNLCQRKYLLYFICEEGVLPFYFILWFEFGVWNKIFFNHTSTNWLLVICSKLNYQNISSDKICLFRLSLVMLILW